MAYEAGRVSANTPPTAEQRIIESMEQRIRQYSRLPKEEIDRQIEVLDREWDIERVLELNASIFGLLGLIMNRKRNRSGRRSAGGWLAVSAGVLGFLGQHAAQGWCPPLPIFRRLGIRTRREIELERYALKALRGDFGTFAQGVGGSESDPDARAEAVLQAMRA
jgi:hypothetical protein